MAVSIAKVAGADTVFGNKRVKVRDLTFSSTYPSGGEVVTAALVGLRKIQQVIFHGNVVSTDQATSCTPTYDYTNSKVLLYEAAASAAPFIIKDASEAHITGASVRATFIGY